MMNMNGEKDDYGGGGGFLLGFGAVTMVGTIGFIVIIYTRIGKKEVI